MKGTKLNKMQEKKLIELLAKPICMATIGEVIETMYIWGVRIQEKPKNLAYGIAGLAAVLGCSVPTAQKLKNSGDIPFMQRGRKIVFDVDAVLEAIK